MAAKKITSNYGVIIGSVGTGKTSFLNKISNGKFTTRAGSTSCTRDVNVVELSHNGVRFLVADTPGMNSESAKIDHALHILGALEYAPLQAMFLTVKYERLGAMQSVLDPIVRRLVKFRSVICVVVTHWDLALSEIDQENASNISKRNPAAEEAELIKSLATRYKVRAFVISKNDDKGNIIKKMIDNLQAPLTVKLNTEEIGKYFDLTSDDFDVSLIIEQLKGTLKEVTKYLKECSEEYSGQAKNDYFYFSQLAIGDYCLMLSQDFTTELGYDLLESDSIQYTHYLALQTHLRSVVEEYRQFAAQEMDDVMFSNTGTYPDTKDYRKCPHCGLVWYRVSACPSVTCGQIETERDIIAGFKSFFNFQFKWKKGQNPLIQFQTKEKKYNFTDRKSDSTKKAGCGKSFDWLKQKPVDMTWFFEVETTDVKVIEQVVEEKALENMEKERRDVKINVHKNDQ